MELHHLNYNPGDIDPWEVVKRLSAENNRLKAENEALRSGGDEPPGRKKLTGFQWFQIIQGLIVAIAAIMTIVNFIWLEQVKEDHRINREIQMELHEEGHLDSETISIDSLAIKKGSPEGA